MSIAMLYPQAPMGRGAEDPARKSIETIDISMIRVRQARQVYRQAPDLAAAVRDGDRKLDDALEEIQRHRDARLRETA